MGRIDSDTRFRVLMRDEFKCVYCGQSAAQHGATIEVDHLIPVAAGGKATMDNLVSACRDCNIGKGAEVLPAAIVTNITQSMRDAQRERMVTTRYDDDVIREVASLRAEGFGYKSIGRLMGLSRDTAKHLVKRAEKMAT